jgi:hypothetical protein
MPEMDGWQVAQRFRRRSRERVAIVMLSASAIDPNHMLDAGRLYDDCLMKPIDLRQLLKIIHALLNIEWLYEPPIPSPAVASAVQIAPPGDDIDELIGLGEIGHVRRILERLSEIETGAPEYGDFVARMRTIVDTFDLKRYTATLVEIRDSHA